MTPDATRMQAWRTRATSGDPFDALRGTHVPAFVRRNARLRQIATQLRKRSIVDLAPLLGVAPFVMSKTLGSYLTASARNPDEAESLADCEAIAELLAQSEGRLGGGAWGYEFDVQTRWAFYAAGSPNLIATFFVGRGFAEAGARHGRPDWLAEFHAAADFLLRDLYDADSPSGPFFRYLPDSNRLVHNANLLGAGLVALSAALCGDTTALDKANVAARTSVSAQRADGSWPYGTGENLGWEDNFHTAYNLDGLLLLWLANGCDPELRLVIERGARHWQDNYFGRDGAPYYEPTRHFPLDSHSAGTAMDVGARLATWGLADPALSQRVAAWTGQHLCSSKEGQVFHQISRLGICDRRTFSRWGDGHNLVGRASLGLLLGEERSPIETEVSSTTGTRCRLQS